MSLIVTPGQLKQKGEFYHQLASMTAAGVTIMQGMDLLRRNAPSRQLKQIATFTMDGLVRGQNFTESLQQSGRDIPDFDLSLIEAGEKSGRLDQCFRILAEFYRERGQLASKVLSQLAYPIFLFHFAVFLFPISLFTGLLLQSQGMPFLLNKIGILLPAYAVVLGILWIFQSKRHPALRNALDTFSSAIPMIGSLKRDLALARLCAALEALINAGVTIIEAWDVAGRASGSPRFVRAIADAKPRVQAGELPSDAISQQGIYPDLFVSSYRTGEMSGQLDDALRRLYRHYQEAATEGLRRFAEWLPRLIYMGVAIIIGYQVITFYQGYFNQINELTQ
jgi:type II secretory pathway component PulF